MQIHHFCFHCQLPAKDGQALSFPSASGTAKAPIKAWLYGLLAHTMAVFAQLLIFCPCFTAKAFNYRAVLIGWLCCLCWPHEWQPYVSVLQQRPQFDSVFHSNCCVYTVQGYALYLGRLCYSKPGSFQVQHCRTKLKQKKLTFMGLPKALLEVNTNTTGSLSTQTIIQHDHVDSWGRTISCLHKHWKLNKPEQ